MAERPRLHRHGRPAFDDVADERRPHREQPEPHPALHGPERGAGPLGDLDLRQTTEIRQLDRLALDVGERRPAPTRSPASRLAATSPQMSGSVSVAGGGTLGVGQLGRRAAAADGVDRPVMDDRQQPRLHAAAALDVAGGVAPGAEKRVLDDILGKGGVGGDPEAIE